MMYLLCCYRIFLKIDKKLLPYLLHEFNHALHYELGLSGDPILCSYKTKFIRDVYQITSAGPGEPVSQSECMIRKVYDQCPEVAQDWDMIEEAWNILGFIEIGGVVYINEFSDCALPYDTKPEGVKTTEFQYHHPNVMLPYIWDNRERAQSYFDRYYGMIDKDWRLGKWKNFDAEDKTNHKGSRYLEAILIRL